jgi:hypothetical protein
LADLNGSVLKERMAGLKAIRDHAEAYAERIRLTLDSAGNQAVTPDMHSRLDPIQRVRNNVLVRRSMGS